MKVIYAVGGGASDPTPDPEPTPPKTVGTDEEREERNIPKGT